MTRIVPTGYYAPWHLQGRKDFTRLLCKRKVLGATIRLGRLKSMRWAASAVPWSRLCTFPLVVCVELTNRCDLDCVMCHRSFMDRPEGDMAWERFQRLVDEMGRQPGVMLVLIGQGEPTLHERFLDAVRLAKETGVERVLLQTNGTRLVEQAEDLVAAGLDDLHVSMDGFRKETFEGIRRGVDAELVARGVEAVVAARRRAGSARPAIALRYCSMPRNLGERDDFWEYWKDRLEEQDEVRFDGLQVYKEAPISDEAAARPCSILWKRVFVRWNGDYAFCCNHKDNRLGIRRNHDEISLRDMWRHPELERIRTLHLRGRKRQIPACAVCALMAPGMVVDDAG